MTVISDQNLCAESRVGSPDFRKALVVGDNVRSSFGSPPPPRFSLQKRKIQPDFESPPLTSVNSAFLTGLFEDVAEAQGDSAPSVGPDTVVSRPSKKTRVSISRSMSRLPSVANLHCVEFDKNDICAIIDAALSPTSPTDIIKIQDGECPPFPQDLNQPSKDGLRPKPGVEDNAKSFSVAFGQQPTFPQLPATISASSCNTLTRNQSDLQSSLAENTEIDSYGWFVETDEDHVRETTVPAVYEPPTSDLAFKAPTAPLATNYDAEVEWAKAADTVDDVLGDFF